MRRFLALTLVLLTAVSPALAVKPVKHKVHKHHSKWNVLFWPSRLSQIIQNKEIDENGLTRYQNLDDVAAAVQRGELVPIPVSDALVVDKHLDPRRRYVRPWTALFLTDISKDFYAQFHEPLMVDSAVRPRDVQKKLRRWNANAAPLDGETASSHMAGSTIDFARGRMTPLEVRWMELRLLLPHIQGLIEVEEEHHQLCFHIQVAMRYPHPIPIETESIPVSDQLEEIPNGTGNNDPGKPEDSNPPGPRGKADTQDIPPDARGRILP